jgi:Protein of unknown function (DUF642)
MASVRFIDETPIGHHFPAVLVCGLWKQVRIYSLTREFDLLTMVRAGHSRLSRGGQSGYGQRLMTGKEDHRATHREMNTMRQLQRTFAAATLLASLMVAPSRADVITNGSFETPTVPAGSFTDFPGTSTGITGWTVVGNDVAVVSGTFVSNGITFQAEDGAQWLDLTGINSNSKANGVSQNVATVIGQSYNVSFWVGSTTDGSIYFPSTVDLSINGGARTSFTNPTAPINMLNWEQFTANFTATSTTTNFTFFNGGASNNNNSALDNVTFTSTAAIPEPGPLVLMGLVVVVVVSGKLVRAYSTRHQCTFAGGVGL